MISVIIPVYKVENYLDKCVESVVLQSYRDLEIILVDDGSPDHCPEMCDEWAKRDSRIKVIHKKNGGLSDARNVGLKAAIGEYVSFIDSDDWVCKEFYSMLLNTMKKEDSDIVECEKLIVSGHEKIEGQTPPKEMFHTGIRKENEINNYTAEEGLRKLIEDRELCQHVWNKLYKMELVRNIPFLKGKLNEDEFWTYQIFGQAHRITKVNKPLYCYLQRVGSIMSQGYSMGRLDGLEAKQRRQEYIEHHYPELSRMGRLNLFSTCIYSYQMSLRYLSGGERNEAQSRINSIQKECRPVQKDLRDLSRKKKAWVRAALVDFKHTCLIRNLLDIGF